MPEATSTGGSGRKPSTPRFTQSDGVPLTAKRRSPSSTVRTGRWSVSACPQALCSRSGATTHTSPSSASASASAASPGAWTPSSLVTRISATLEHSVVGPRRHRVHLERVAFTHDLVERLDVLPILAVHLDGDVEVAVDLVRADDEGVRGAGEL